MIDNATMTMPHLTTVRTLILLAVLALPSISSSQEADGLDGRRIVAVADIHGALDSFTSILREVGLVDADLHWSGGDTILVQTGDFTDRGPEVRACMDLLMQLQEEAAEHGGEVIVVRGNHEAMNLVDFLRDNSPDDSAGFIDRNSEERREDAYREWAAVQRRRAESAGEPQVQLTDDMKHTWEETHPLGYVERMSAFGAEGRYGRWLRGLPTAVRIGDILFMHAGLNPVYGDKSVDEINALVADEMRRFDEAKAAMVRRGLIAAHADLIEMIIAADEQLARWMAIFEETGERPGSDERDLIMTLDWMLDYQSWEALAEDGLLWFRGLARWSEAEHDEEVRELLGAQGINHIVVGHTVQADGNIQARFNGAVFVADTGMLVDEYDGRPSALEIEGGRFTAIYVGERRQLYPATDDEHRDTRSRVVGDFAAAGSGHPPLPLPLPGHRLDQW